ncbi:MAG: hypothetical protein FJY20_05435 [Bacteroidetes bacterium]|nr:hypothetical protein [Bacteroidota bacterium]
MKKLLIILFLFNIGDESNAQKYMYGLGSNISLLTADINTPSEQYDFVMAVTHFSYTPRFILTNGDNSSLTVGFPMGAGVGFLTSAGNATGIAWGADAPVAFDYNMGNMSTPENEKKFGGTSVADLDICIQDTELMVKQNQ